MQCSTKVVIQCAARKRPGAGHLLSANRTPVLFVADPEAAPADPAHEYARPDDPSGTGLSWSQVLLKYNAETKSNPLGLYPAYQLYLHKTYQRLVERFGLEKVYVLSAGWGLIRADFLTPYYDITFSQSAEPYKRRRRTDHYEDFRMLADEPDEDIVFFGGKGYLALFGELTDAIRSRKTVFYRSKDAPHMTGCTLRRFKTTTCTNWHYQCAKDFLDGAVKIQ
jgi:hypothetical protein